MKFKGKNNHNKYKTYKKNRKDTDFSTLIQEAKAFSLNIKEFEAKHGLQGLDFFSKVIKANEIVLKTKREISAMTRMDVLKFSFWEGEKFEKALAEHKNSLSAIDESLKKIETNKQYIQEIKQIQNKYS